MARAVLLGLMAVLVGGGSALGASGADKFRMPSGNVYCAYEHYSFSPTDLRCEIRTKIRPKTGACDDGYIMRQTGAARAFCATDTIYDPAAPVLTYGTTRQFGVFRCSSSASGLRCANASGQGFFLSTQHSYTFKEPAAQNGAFKTPTGNI